MTWFTNPAFVKIAVLVSSALWVAAIFAILLALSRLRRRLTREPDFTAPHPGSGTDAFATATVQGVIQRLKEQEKELHRLRQLETQRAAASENVSSAILANLTSGVLLFSPAGLVQQANPASREILGYASPVGLHARELFRNAAPLSSPGAPAEFAPDQAIERVLRDGQSFRRMEFAYTTPAGEQRVIGITVSPVRGATGVVVGAACLISDLTEITALAREVRLREKLSALGEMSAGIAHEFKNSLTTISGYAQMLVQETDAAALRDFSIKINTETTELARIVTDFLEFARPSGTAARNTVPLDVLQLLREAAETCGVALNVAGSEPLPDATVLGDATALRQAFSNLLRNSQEAAREDVPLRIDVVACVNGDSVQLVLSDNGKGIAAADLPKVFIPFFTTKERGTGLGLALVHRIVSEHGGTVTVSSNGHGASFTVELPACGKQAKSAAESR